MCTNMPLLPGAVYCCFNKNYNMFHMTLHAGLANPTCLQSWCCSVCELRESNSKKEKKGEFWFLLENRHFLLILTPFPYMNLLVSGVM